MLADATGEVRVNMFNAEGELLFGMTSDEVRLSIPLSLTHNILIYTGAFCSRIAR